MYLLNTATDIEWVIAPTGSPPLLADLDVIIARPDGLSEYFSSAITAPNYTPPDASTPGLARYTFTPTLEGHYRLYLVIGTETNYDVISSVDIFVFDNVTAVNPAKTKAYGFNGNIEVRDEGIILSSNVAVLDFLGPRVAVVENAGVAQIFIDDFPTIPYQVPADLLTALSGALTESQLFQTLKDRIDLIDGIHPGSVNARISVVQGQLDILQADVDDPVTGLSATSTALDLVETWVEVFDDAIIAYSGGTTQFVTQVGDNQTTIQTHTSSLNGLEAQYTVKVDANGYVSGFGLASTLKDAVPFSEFIIVADQFSIAPVATDPDAIDASPFFHLTVPTLIDGELIPAGTYMKSAWIHNAAIQNAQIGDVIESADGGISWRIDKTGGISGRSITLRDNVGGLLVDPDGNGDLWQTFGTLVNETPSGSGFFNDATHLGFYDAGTWRTYMDKSGDFFLVGGANGSLTWDASTQTLSITGNITVTNPEDFTVTAGNGVNIANAERSWFNSRSILPSNLFAKSASVASIILTDVGVLYSPKVIQIEASAADAWVFYGAHTADYNIPITPNRKWIVSFYVKVSPINSPKTTNNIQTYLRTNEAGVYRGGQQFSVPADGNWYRRSYAIDFTATGLNDASTAMAFRVDNDSFNSAGNTFIQIDGLMIEEQIGTDDTPSSYVRPYNSVPETGTVGSNQIANSLAWPIEYGWAKGGTLSASHTLANWDNATTYSPKDREVLALFDDVPSTGTDAQTTWVSPTEDDGTSQRLFPVEPGKTYQFSAKIGALRCNTHIEIDWYDNSATPAYISFDASEVNDNELAGGDELADFKHVAVTATAPAAARFARLYLIKYGTDTGASPDSSHLVATEMMFCEVPAFFSAIVPYSPGDRTTQVLEQGTIIHGGGVTIDGGGAFNSVGLINEDVDVTAGVWLGYNGTNYTFGVGDGDTKFIKYDGTTFEVSKDVNLKGIGSITAKNIFYHNFMDRSDDFVNSSQSTPATIDKPLNNHGFRIRGVNGVDGWIYRQRYQTFADSTWGKNRILRFTGTMDSQADMSTSVVSFIGTGYVNIVAPSVGFEFIRSGTLIHVYPRVSRGGAGTRWGFGNGASSMFNFSYLGSFDLKLELRFNTGVSVEFWINGVLRYTHTNTTHMPIASDGEDDNIVYILIYRTSAPGTVDLYCDELMFLQEE